MPTEFPYTRCAWATDSRRTLRAAADDGQAQIADGAKEIGNASEPVRVGLFAAAGAEHHPEQGDRHHQPHQSVPPSTITELRSFGSLLAMSG